MKAKKLKVWPGGRLALWFRDLRFRAKRFWCTHRTSFYMHIEERGIWGTRCQRCGYFEPEE